MAPWFYTKVNPFCTSGSKYLWNPIQFLRYLYIDLQQIINSVIQQNAYFESPKNIFICMLFNDHDEIRKIAFSKLINAQENNEEESICFFKILPLNFYADDYVDLINRENNQII